MKTYLPGILSSSFKNSNNFFVQRTCLPARSPNHSLPDLIYLTDARLCSIHTTPFEVEYILKRLNCNKSTGPDGVSNRILKEAAFSLSYPLADIFNKSLESGIFPSSWKSACVHPVPKGAGGRTPDKYRPISILSNLSKVLERIIYKKLFKYCNENNLLKSRNPGFKPKDSAVNRLVELVLNIESSLNDKEEIGIVFLDISKAFDKIWHEGLLFKLSDRTQYVVLNGSAASSEPVMAGVPQGSILGPLLFLIYIIDITENIESDMTLFADDASVLKKFKDRIIIKSTLNNDMIKICTWSNQWLVTFSEIKCKFMLVTNTLLVQLNTRHKMP